MKIWDLHCHPNGPGDNPVRRMERILKYADRMDVERLCVYMGHPWDHHAGPELFTRVNNDVLDIVRAFPDRVFGFVYLNPKYLKESRGELERCVAEGPLVGIKLWQGWKCTNSELDPIVERAAELRAVLFQHAWFNTAEDNPDASTPSDLAALSSRHPGVPLICGHTGGDWELGIRAIRGRKEIYGDLAGSEPVAGFVEMAVREMGAQRIIYGSDVSGRSFASQLAKVLGANITTAQKERILRDNLRDLMRPILTSKGIRV
jgi:predicted TIM-barrel fold metal-dependent hydrolase